MSFLSEQSSQLSLSQIQKQFIRFSFLYLFSVNPWLFLTSSIIHSLFSRTCFSLSFKENNYKSKKKRCPERSCYTCSQSIQTTSLPEKSQHDARTKTRTWDYRTKMHTLDLCLLCGGNQSSLITKDKTSKTFNSVWFLLAKEDDVLGGESIYFDKTGNKIMCANKLNCIYQKQPCLHS